MKVAMDNIRTISQRLLIATLFAAASFVFAGTSKAATQELIVNGGFEATPIDSGWVVSSGYPFSSVYHWSGTHAAELAKDVSPQTISQTVTVPQNIDALHFTYRYGWIRTKFSQPTVDFDVRVINVADLSEVWCVFSTPPQYQYPQGWYGKGDCTLSPNDVAGKTLRIQFTATEQFMDTHLELDDVSLRATLHTAPAAVKNPVENSETGKRNAVQSDHVAPTTWATTFPRPSAERAWTVPTTTRVILTNRDDQTADKIITYYAWDTGRYRSYAGAVSVPTKKGRHTLSFFSVDQAGNREKAQHLRYVVRGR